MRINILAFLGLFLTLAGSALMLTGSLKAQTSNPNLPNQAPQTEAQPPVAFRIIYEVASDDKVGQSLETAVNSEAKSASDALAITSGEAKPNDPSTVEVRIMTRRVSDTQTTLILIATYHVKGEKIPLFLNAGGEQVGATQVTETANEILMESAMIVIDLETEPPVETSKPVSKI